MSGSRPLPTSISWAAIPTGGWGFSGWRGICSGLGRCTIPQGETGTLTATFTQLPSVSIPDKHAPQPVIDKVVIKSATATFVFARPASGAQLQCALVRHRLGKHAYQLTPSYSPCGRTKTYRHMHSGTYTLYVRTVLGATHSVAAERVFKVR